MAPQSYPFTCPDHNQPAINDASDWQTHLASEHSAANPQELTDLEARISYSASATGSAIPAVQLNDVYAAYGISATKLAARTVDSLSGANLLTKAEVLGFLQAFGKALSPAVVPTTIGDFSLDFFELVLRTAASDQLAEAGGFSLIDDQGNSAFIPWEELFTAGAKHFQPRNKIFKPRKLMKSIEDLLDMMWRDKKIKALDSIRTHGTALSRQMICKNGLPAPAWVAVPDLFNDRLTPEFIQMRKHRALYIQLAKKAEVEEITRLPNAGASGTEVVPTEPADQAAARLDEAHETARRIQLLKAKFKLPPSFGI